MSFLVTEPASVKTTKRNQNTDPQLAKVTHWTHLFLTMECPRERTPHSLRRLSGGSIIGKITRPSSYSALLPHTDSSMVFARWRQCAPPPNTCFLGLTRVQIPNGISISSAVFAQLTGECRYTLQWAPFTALKIAHSLGGIWTQHVVLWTHPSPQPKWHLNRFNRFCRAHCCNDRLTDRQTNRLT